MQMMVQAAHLARLNDPAGCIGGEDCAVNSNYDYDYDADTASKMWSIYSSLRDSLHLSPH